MPVSYDEARKILTRVAIRKPLASVHVPIHDALNRIVAHDYDSPVSTPEFDTSAMDGFAVISKQTINASADEPISFAIRGIIAAGDLPPVICNTADELSCVEIMTGARFPVGFDAVIPVEYADIKSGSMRVIAPVVKNHHRRFAGSDFEKGSRIVSAGMVVKPSDIMALASVGIRELEVRRIRVGVWSTGLEIANGMIPDVNGPYLIAALRELGADVSFLGTIPDDANTLVQAIQQAEFDLLLTTGAVSAGKFDFVRTSLDYLGAEIHFHHVAMRPGHPVLCASVGETVFFGLPGNPIATAACFRFLVVPFLVGYQEPIKAKLAVPVFAHLDMFRHGKLSNGVAELNQQQSPAKIEPFSRSNCWIHIPRSLDVGDEVDCYPL